MTEFAYWLPLVNASKMFDFVIPLNRDDLFEAATRNQYTVENVYNTRDLKIKLKVGNMLMHNDVYT